jgi:signal transduction histidine kinase
MSLRSKMIAQNITAILVFNTISISVGFLVFWFTAVPYIGDRLRENAGHIAAWYFIIGGFAVFILTVIGALWVINATVSHVSGPLQRLKRAAIEIRDGNLGYELVVTGHDEFTELAACFEQMRIRLRDSMRQKEKSENERRDMTAYIAHDLKTPITSIIGYSEGILDNVADTPEKIREYAAVIYKKAKNLESLADDLSLLSRLENAQLVLDKREEDMGTFISEIAEEFSHNEPEIKISANLESNLTASVDREKMARVLLNIFQNSVKYKKPDQAGSELTLTLIRQNDDLLFSAADNGMGITQNDLPYVFERFFRADTSRGKQSGSGLGLSISRQIVRLHGGEIWIVGNPAGGITINIKLPISKKREN